MNPATVQTAVVLEVTVTAKLEVAVGAMRNGVVEKLRAPGLVKLMV